MVCVSCLAVVPLSMGLGLTANNSIYVGTLLTIISLCIYLHYKEFVHCSQCI